MFSFSVKRILYNYHKTDGWPSKNLEDIYQNIIRNAKFILLNILIKSVYWGKVVHSFKYKWKWFKPTFVSFLFNIHLNHSIVKKTQWMVCVVKEKWNGTMLAFIPHIKRCTCCIRHTSFHCLWLNLFFM